MILPLEILIDCFFLSFKNGSDDPARYSLDEYFMPLVEIKDLNALLDNKPFFDEPVKNKQEAFEKLINMSKNNDYTTGNLLYHQKYFFYRTSRDTSSI